MRMLLPFLLVAGFAAGCVSTRVETVHDDPAKFEHYADYGWIESPDAVVDNLTRRGVLLGDIHRAVDQELAADGYGQSDDPDFRVAVHAAITQRVTGATLDSWGYTYRRRGTGWNSVSVTAMDAEGYQEGTLIIDIVDAASNELVWRGTATDVIRGDATEKAMEAVIELMADFPPVR